MNNARDAYHIRTQPVIVAPDGKSAKLRTRLFSYSACASGRRRTGEV